MPESVHAQADFDECAEPGPIIERASSEMRWSPDGKWLAMATDAIKDVEEGCYTDTKLEVYDGTTSQVIFAYPNDDIVIAGLAWSPDGSRLVTSDLAGIVQIWDTADWKFVGSYSISKWGLIEATWHPHQKRLAVAGYDGIIYVLNPDNGQVIQQVSIGQENPTDGNIPIGYLEWSPDGTKVGVGRVDNSLLILDAINLEVIGTLLPSKNMNPLAVDGRWSPDSKLIAVQYHNSYDAELWDVQTGKKLLTLTGHTSYLNGRAWSPSGKLIATTSMDKTVRIWDVATGQQQKVIAGPNDIDQTLHIDWSIDGKIAYGYSIKKGIEPPPIIPQIIVIPDSVK